MITDKSRYGHDAVLDLDCGDSVQVLRTEPMTLTEQEQKIVQKYLGIALLEKSYIDANGHLMVVLSDGRTLDVGSARGLPGATPYLGENGNWFVEGVDTLQSARGLSGFTPYIGENEHWWIDKTDTGIPARGIPLTEKADNTRFLRNDGTWQKVTPENIGAAQAGVVADHESRIEALEQRTVTAPYYTDDSVAYTKEVPENALPFASVDMIGGMTRKCNQLWDEQWKTGYYDTTDGNFISDSTFLACKNKVKVLPNTTYYMTCSVEKRIVFYDIEQNYISCIEYARKSVFTTPDGCYYMTFSLWSTYGVVYQNDIMINLGTTALPYEPYFDGLRSAPVTEMESVGVNLCDLSRIPNNLNGLTFITNTDGTVTINGTANDYTTVYFDKINLKTGEKFYCLGGGNGTIFTFNGHMGDTFIKNIAWTEDNTVVQTIECDGTYDSFYPIILIQPGQSFSNATVRFIVSKTPFVSFSPYRRNTLPVPAAVQALDGYGWGVNADCYNYIDWERKRFVKRVEKFVLQGTEHWVISNSNMFTSKFDSASPDMSPSLSDGAFDSRMLNGNVKFVVYTNGAYTVETWKSYLAENPMTVYYELAEPVITDISDLLTDDNLIRVEGGGTVTMVNEYGYDVPSEITYARLTWQ